MIIIDEKRARLTMRPWALVLSIAAGVLCVVVNAGAQQVKIMPAGEKAKIKGRIAQRGAETFVIDSSSGEKLVVLLTDTTSVKTNKKGLGIFRRGEEYAVTSLLRGLVVEVEGVGNEKGQLVSEKIRFNESDLQAAMTPESRAAPVEEANKANKKLSGQVDEAGLDNFDEKDQAIVYFEVNSFTISPKAKKELDDLAREAMKSTGYIIEVSGFSDATGNAEMNLVLSQRRADAVVKYLVTSGKVPTRRIVTPIGYGATMSEADRDNPKGRKLERRVEARLLISRGQN
jgi:outer membrane protein OmpA-like peptidoglycan-associated protein